MPIVGTFFHHISENEEYETIGLVCQSKVGGLLNNPRHLLLVEKRGDTRTSTVRLADAPFPLQQKVLAYLKETRFSGSTENFPKHDFTVQKEYNRNKPLAILFFSPEESTPITSLKQLEQVLERFLPISEYQYGSTVRIFESLHSQFGHTTPPKLSL